MMFKQQSFGKLYPPSTSKSKVSEGAPPRSRVSMAVSMRDLDVAFQGAGQKAGLEIWCIENCRPTPIPNESHGKFFTGDAYIVLKTTALKSGALCYDIHYWLGKNTRQDEADSAAIKAVELDATLGGRAVQYREVQGHETEKFLSYFKPCIIPREGGVASGFKHTEINEQERENHLYVCRGKHAVHVKEVYFARSSLSHDDIFILDTKSKIFQFSGSNSSIQERAKALEVVQYLRDTYHEGKCDVASVEDGKMMPDAEAGEFWGFFGGFAPLPRKTSENDATIEDIPVKLYCIEKGQPVPIEALHLKKELLETDKCYVLDCGVDVFVWMGRSTSLADRKSASTAAEELLFGQNRTQCYIIRVMERFETVPFRSKFSVWPQTDDVAVSDHGKGKVAALLRRQGLNVKGILKATPTKEEPQPYIDCTGNLQIWRVDGHEKKLVPSSEQFKFYSGDCYIFQYTHPVDDEEKILVGTWFGKKSVEEERASAISLASKMVESLKFQAAQARIYEGKEPVQFFSILQRFILFKGGLSSGYKNYIKENSTEDDTYSEDGTALFRVQGSGPDNMQAIQVDLVASSLNSSYCYILHSGSTVFTWAGSFTMAEDQELIERLVDLIKPNMQSKPQKEGNEFEQFWSLLGGKCEYRNQKITKEAESDPHLFSCNFSKGKLTVTEIFNFTQDDLMAEDIYVLDCRSDIFVWVGHEVKPKNRVGALEIGEKFLEQDFLLEKLSHETPIFVITEENEPPFFTRFFTWDPAKSAMHGNSFQRKLAIVKDGVTPTSLDKPKRRVPASQGGRSSSPTEKPQRSRSMCFSPERVRVRGRSPAFNALAATFENPNRNLSTPPPVVKKVYPKSFTPESANATPNKAPAIAALTTTFEKARENVVSPKLSKVSPDANKSGPVGNVEENKDTVNHKVESLTIQEDVKQTEAEDDVGQVIFPYERLKTDSVDPMSEIDVTKRETYLSSEEFKAKFGMKRDAFYKLPKWKQNKLKMALKLF